MKKLIALLLCLTAPVALGTVTNEVSEATLNGTCTGSGTGPYTIPFVYAAPSHLQVSNGTSTLALTTDYTVSRSVALTPSVATLSLTAGSKCPSGGVLTVRRVVPFTQPTSFKTQGTFTPASIEAALDRLTMIAQQIQAGVLPAVYSPVTASGATTAISLPDRFADFLSIKDFGAVCDGTTNDATAIQAAITAALAARKAVFINPSASGCVIASTSSVTINAPLTIYGHGPASTIYIKGTWGTTADTGYFTVANASTAITNVTFRDFRVVGDYPSGTPGPNPTTMQVIRFGTASTTIVVNNVRVSGMTFEKIGGAAVGGNGGNVDFASCCQSSGHSFENNIVRNSGNLDSYVNPFSNGIKGWSIVGNSFIDLDGMAIELGGGGAGHVVDGNYFDNINRNAVSTEDAATTTGHTVISNNVMQNVGQGGVDGVTWDACIQIGQSGATGRTSVIGNTLTDCGGGGIAHVGDAAGASLLVADNWIDCPNKNASGKAISSGGASAGISVKNRVRQIVTGNTVRACSGGGDTFVYGILANGTSGTDSWVDDNTTIGTFSTRSMILSTTLSGSGGARAYVGRNNFDMTAGQYVAPSDSTDAEVIPYFAANDTTPSVKGWHVWRTANTNPTTITNFDDGSKGQIFTLFINDSNTTLASGNINLRGGGTRSYPIGTTLQFLYANLAGYVWTEIPFYAGTVDPLLGTANTWTKTQTITSTSGAAIAATGAAGEAAATFAAGSGATPTRGAINLACTGTPPSGASAGDVWCTDSGGSLQYIGVKLGSNTIYLANGVNAGTKTLAAGVGTVTIGSGWRACVCSNTGSTNAVYCNYSAPTLTITGTGTDTIGYVCQ